MGARVEPASTAKTAVTSALLVGALLCCLYLLSFSTSFRLDDEHILAARAQSLALRGTFDEPQVYGNLRVRELAAMGDQAKQIEPLHTLLSAGLYRAAVEAGLGGTQAVFLLNLYLTALCAGLLTLTVVVLGYPAATARWCGLLFGAGTIAWVYATTLVRDTLAMTAVTVALFGAVLVLRTSGPRRAVGAVLVPLGLLVGALAKNTVVALGLGLLVGAAVVALPALRTERRARRVLAMSLGFGLLLFIAWSWLPGTGPLARYSLPYYRALLEHFAGSLDGKLIGATLGPFLSPAKSIFLFSPPLVLGLLGAWRTERRLSVPALTGTVSLALAQGLFYRDRWAGAIGWGLRFMLPALPGLLLLAAPAVERLRSSTRGKATLWLILGGSMVIQAAGAWVDWRAASDAWREQGLNVAHPAADWDARFLAIPEQIRGLVDPAAWLPVWWRMRSVPGVVWTAGATVVLGVGLAGMLASPARRFDRRATRWAGAAAIAAACALPIFPTLWVTRADPRFGGDRPEFAEALAAWSDEGRDGDLVVVDSYGTPLWSYFLNHWRSPVAWFSLPFEIPGSAELETLPAGELGEASRGLFARLGSRQERLWYYESSEAPDYGLHREPAWLDTRFALVEQRALAGESRVDLRIYARRGP